MKDKLQNVLLSISSKVETNKYLGSIKEAFTMFVPFIIVGSFGSMLNILVSGANGLAQWVPWLSNLSPAFPAINFVTISCMSLPIAFLIGYKLAEKENLPQLESGLIGLLSYLAVCPNTISTVVEGLKDPVVLNGLGAGVIAAFIAVVATNIGFLTCGVLDCPPGLPVFVTGFISYGIHGIIVQAIILIVTFIIWVPFVLMSNKQAKLEQK